MLVCAACEFWTLRSIELVRAENDAVLFVRKFLLDVAVVLGLHSLSSFDAIIGIWSVFPSSFRAHAWREWAKFGVPFDWPFAIIPLDTHASTACGFHKKETNAVASWKIHAWLRRSMVFKRK